MEVDDVKDDSFRSRNPSSLQMKPLEFADEPQRVTKDLDELRVSRLESASSCGSSQEFVEFKVYNDVADKIPLYLHEAELSGGAYAAHVKHRILQNLAHEAPYLHKAEFSEGAFVESLIAALDRCEAQVQEFMIDLVPIVYRHQCKHLLETLRPIAINNFKRYHSALDALQKLEVDGVGVSSSRQLRNCAHFCFESLVGLAWKLQLVVDLIRQCSTNTENLHKTALKLADLPPPPSMSRWSEFSIAIRNCEWNMDLVELAFYTLEKLTSGSIHIFQDVSFKWSEGKGRMVLQIRGMLGKQDNRLAKPMLDVMKELEAKDLADLVHQLEQLRFEVASKWKPLRIILRDNVAKVVPNRVAMANFLSKKLSGPIPHASILPWTFRVEPFTLKYIEYIDAGSSGMVRKYSWFGENVAVKSIRSPGLRRHKFEEEAAILATVQHPNVVRFIGCSFIEEKNIGMLIMELMDYDLRTVLDSRVIEVGSGSSPFSTIVAIDIIQQIAQAMRHLWDHKILHRDLKAKNVLVNIHRFGGGSNTSLLRHSDVSIILPHIEETYVVKLADFGLAKSPPATPMVGTTGWRAPEVFHVWDIEVTSLYKWPADVYSFGMTCYEILTGKLPFEEFTNLGIHEYVMAGGRPQGLDELEIPEFLKELVKRCWATNPDERPTFEEIEKSLWECRVKAILPVFERHITPIALSGSTSEISKDIILQKAGKPSLIGDNLVIDLTRDLLGVSSTGYVISCSLGQGPSEACALKRIDLVDQKTPDLARLDNLHVVRLFNHWIEERDLFLLMELMDGDLARLIARTKKAGASPFALHVTVDLMLQIAEGMLYLHEMDVSHPHLKCENVLFKIKNKTEAIRVGNVLVKLGGFGFPRPADVVSKNRDVLCFGLTCLEILTGDKWSDVAFGADKVARSSIPGTTPIILGDCIRSCLDTQTSFADVVTVLSMAKCYILKRCNDEILFTNESIETEILPIKPDGGPEEIFAVHQLHPPLDDVSSSVTHATLIFFHGFHKVPEEWRRTWMTRDNKHVWPQKWLPEDLGAGNIRVLSMSFDGNSNVSNKYNRLEMGQNLVQRLVLNPRWKLGETGEAIFLVGHSFGGVLIKSLVTKARSLVSARVPNSEEVMKCENFLKRLATSVFYSVPHGVEFENFISECRNVLPLQRSSFLQSLWEDTGFVPDMVHLSAAFESAIPEKMNILVFLEGKPMSKKRVLVTEKSYEGQPGSWEWHKIEKDNHFEVCRPDSKKHSGYMILLHHLQQHMRIGI